MMEGPQCSQINIKKKEKLRGVRGPWELGERELEGSTRKPEGPDPQY